MDNETKYRNALLWAFDRLSVDGGMSPAEQRATMREIGNVLTGRLSRANSMQTPLRPCKPFNRGADMQQRLKTGEIVFQCDAAGCLDVHRAKSPVFMRAAQEARDAGWHTATIVPGRFTHRCPAHA